MMTREEAIAILQDKYDCCKSFYDLAAHPEEDYPEMAKYLQALQIALSALRPVSREKVERMRGEWISTGAISCKCSSCNHLEPKYRVDEYNFCPYCMAPMTDEAVEMVMERMEALHDTEN